MKARLLIALTAAGAGALALPADAQTAPARTREIIVYGNDPCPRSTDDDVVVCARRSEKERYRLPEALRPSGPPQLSQSWAARSKALATVGSTGPGTCSGVGPGGVDGCALKEIQQGVAERAEQDAGDTPPE
ncbi:hypothetical protein GCM10022280_25390 [Sphingomonas swuensis]|uniref:Secreted protein n=1 Tax=Sphingomonas swuensis TaxID=977800 RepID=A0ABP7TAR9_9SPHN